METMNLETLKRYVESMDDYTMVEVEFVELGDENE